MNAPEARAILAQISYLGWTPTMGNYTTGAFWLQWTWRTNGIERKGQRWYVANNLTTSELVQLAWQGVRAVELEEAERHFLYRGEPIFGECDVDQLSQLHTRLRVEEQKRYDDEEKHG